MGGTATLRSGAASGVGAGFSSAGVMASRGLLSRIAESLACMAALETVWGSKGELLLGLVKAVAISSMAASINSSLLAMGMETLVGNHSRVSDVQTASVFHT